MRYYLNFSKFVYINFRIPNKGDNYNTFYKLLKVIIGRHDSQYNATQHNDTLHDDIQHNNK